MNHIGIDMSKDTFHAAFDDKKVKVFANTKPGIAAFLKAIDDLGFAIEDTKIGVESTGIYHLLFCHSITRAGYAVFLINPLITHRIIVAGSLQSVKNDRKDAISIREAVLTGKGYLYAQSETVEVMRALFREYASLTLMKSTCQQQLFVRKKQQEVVSARLKSSFPRLKGFLERERKQLRKEMAGR